MVRQPDAKWEKLAVGGLKIVQLQVYPAGMLVEPFVSHLAVALKTAMDEAIRIQPLRKSNYLR